MIHAPSKYSATIYNATTLRSTPHFVHDIQGLVGPITCMLVTFKPTYDNKSIGTALTSLNALRNQIEASQYR